MKAALTTLLIFGMSLLIGWPWIVGPRPPTTQKHALGLYLERFGVYVMVLIVLFFACAVLASILARRAREEYKEEALSNMKFLIESTLEDHRKKDAGSDA